MNSKATRVSEKEAEGRPFLPTQRGSLVDGVPQQRSLKGLLLPRLLADAIVLETAISLAIPESRSRTLTVSRSLTSDTSHNSRHVPKSRIYLLFSQPDSVHFTFSVQPSAFSGTVPQLTQRADEVNKTYTNLTYPPRQRPHPDYIVTTSKGSHHVVRMWCIFPILPCTR